MGSPSLKKEEGLGYWKAVVHWGGKGAKEGSVAKNTGRGLLLNFSAKDASVAKVLEDSRFVSRMYRQRLKRQCLTDSRQRWGAM